MRFGLTKNHEGVRGSAGVMAGTLAFVLLTTLAGLAVYVWAPRYRGLLLDEDSLVENLSAGLYLLTFAVGLRLALRTTVYRKTLLVLSATGLVGFLDEVAFGARLLGLEMPRLLGVVVDSAHDGFELGFRVVEHFVRSRAVLVYPALLAGLAGIVLLALRRSPRQRVRLAGLHREPAFGLAVLFALLILAALIIDLELVHHDALVVVEELFEMNAAAVLLCCCLVVHARRRPTHPGKPGAGQNERALA